LRSSAESSVPFPLREHGGALVRELARIGLRAEEVLDASVNVNPYGPSPRVVEAIRATRVERYPDPTAYPAREAIAAACRASPESVVVGNGAVDLLWTAARALLSPGEAALVVEPAFSEFAAAAAAAHGRVLAWRAREEDHFAVDLAAVSDLARSIEARLVYVCTPANPTGCPLDPRAIADFAGAHGGRFVVLDESFLALSDHADAESWPMPDNVIRVRSMTKDHALPGVRVGYLLAEARIAARIESARPPWTTSAFAQAAAAAAVAEKEFVAASRLRVLGDRRRLSAALCAMGFSPCPSSTLFLLVPVGSGTHTRARLLERHGVLVRDCSSFGLPGYVRVCAQPAIREPRLLAAFGEEADRCLPAR
jgi:histidinol-phosphate/aromatic aminotransferase/cobyric acid decarboxylase-like protein